MSRPREARSYIIGRNEKEVRRIMNVLAVGCHPDDLELACYGTLAKYKKAGHDVAVCHVANGDLGHMVIMPEELRKIRYDEADRAAKIIGAAHYTIDTGDLYVSANNDELIRKLADVVREVQPDVVITHAERDYMDDHMQTCRATLKATFAASCKHYDIETTKAIAPLVPVYHMDTLAGVDFNPTEYVDISDCIDIKLEALSCHESQLKWMKEHDNIDFLDFIRTCSKARGYQCGVAYAEGFRHDRNYLRLVPARLLP
jgi:LmbE family N-acetylglucosaminyl deacetylase